MNEAQIAWVAGLLEADGCFTVSNTKGCPVVRVQCHMTDKDVLERLAEVVGSGVVRGPIRISEATLAKGNVNNKKPMYYWCIMQREAVDDLLERLLPWMGERRSQRIIELQGIQATRRGRSEDWTHCKNGHEFTEENTYRWNGGARSCRRCRNERLRAHRRKAALS